MSIFLCDFYQLVQRHYVMEYDKQTKVKLPNMLKISWDTSVMNYVPTRDKFPHLYGIIFMPNSH